MRLTRITREDDYEKRWIVVGPNGALEAVTQHMDRAGGDGQGMPECPWCHADSDGDWHAAGCELVAARAALAKARGEQP